MSALAQEQERKQSIQFKQVLAATDFSTASAGALSFALAIARRYGSMLSVVHAVPSEPREPIPLEPLPRELNRRRLEADQQMKAIDYEVQKCNIRHRLLVTQGRVWDVLAGVIRCESIDLLVMGTHGRGGLSKAILGSVAEEVLRLAPCPVLTIGPHVPATNTKAGEFQRILYATDFGTAATRALPYALGLAENYGAKLVLVHMVPPMPGPDIGPAAYGPSSYGAQEFIQWERTARDESREKLAQLIPPNAGLASPPECVAGMDFLPEGILEVAASRRIDLIVMGAHHTSSPRLAAHLPWALAHEIISHAKCPVLTVSD